MSTAPTVPSFVRPDLVCDDVPVGSRVSLRASRCTGCERVEFPAHQHRCPACAAEVVDHTLEGAAVLHGATEVRYPPPDAKVEAPYTVVAARFEAENLVVLGLMDRYVEVSELPLGARLETCVIGYEGGATYGFRIATASDDAVGAP